MDVCLGCNSALDHLLRPAMRPHANHENPARINRVWTPGPHRLPDRAPGKEEAARLATGPLAHLDRPARIVVSSAAGRGAQGMLHAGVWRGPVPAGGIVRLGNGLLSSSPEFAFAQVAPRLDELELLALAYEVCGTYALDRRAEQGAVYDLEPLSDASTLRSRLLEISDAYGVRKALRALRYLADGPSASPMETRLVMALCLPRRLGGYGIELPVLNSPIEVPPALRGMARRASFRCDLFWPSAKLDVEYDSDEMHDGERGIERDARRRNALQEMGVTVVTVTRGQVRDPVALTALAQVICQHLGRRYRPQARDYPERNRRLLGRLFCHPGALDWRGALVGR